MEEPVDESSFFPVRSLDAVGLTWWPSDVIEMLPIKVVTDSTWVPATRIKTVHNKSSDTDEYHCDKDRKDERKNVYHIDRPPTERRQYREQSEIYNILEKNRSQYPENTSR